MSSTLTPSEALHLYEKVRQIGEENGLVVRWQPEPQRFTLTLPCTIRGEDAEFVYYLSLVYATSSRHLEAHIEAAAQCLLGKFHDEVENGYE